MKKAKFKTKKQAKEKYAQDSILLTDETLQPGSASNEEAFVATDGGDVIFGDDNSNILKGLGGNDTINGLGGIDTLIGGEGTDSFVFSGDPFQGINVAADGRQIVNQPDELEDFDIAEDRFSLNAADLDIERPISFVNGTAESLVASGVSDANLVVIQGPFANAGVAANAIATTGVASGPGAFVYFNENLQINRLVYSSDLGSAETDISILASIRSLTEGATLQALHEFSADNFALQGETITGDGDDNFLLGTIGEDTIDGSSGDDFIDGLEGIDQLTGGEGNDAFGFGNEPFKGVDVSAAGRQVVNQPDELTDFDIADDQFALDRNVLGIEGDAVFVNGTAEELAASDVGNANLVVIQGPFANAGVAANAIAGSSVASGPGAFIYFNENLQINRLVYSSDLSSAEADISILANIRSLTEDAALQALPEFSADNFALQSENIVGDDDANLLLGTFGEDTISGNDGDDFIDGLEGIDQLTGGEGNDTFGFGNEPFKGVDVSAAGRQVVNQPDELTDFDVLADQFALDRDVLGIDKKAVFVNGTADELAQAKGPKANLVVIQGEFANAGVAANAIAQSGVAKGAGAFVYFNQNLQINRLVYSANLSSAEADISILGNIRSLTGEAAVNALPSFSADNFTLLDQRIIDESNARIIAGDKGNDLISGNDETQVLIGNRGDDIIFGNGGGDVISGDRARGRGRKGGNDSLFGGDGNDVINAGGGDDRVFGESGDDILIGGGGDDLITGGLGDDFLIGDNIFARGGWRGSDTFVLTSGAGTDVVLDFEVGNDYLGLSDSISYGSLTFEGDKVQLGEETLMSLAGVDTTTLGEQSFVTV